MNAGAGCFCRVAVMTGQVIKIGEKDKMVTPEMVAEQIEKLKSIEGGVEYPDTISLIASINKALGIKND
jgi:hypothetical protein